MSPKDATKRFYDLVWPNRAALLRFALILTGQQADAEDLVQETMIKAFRNIGRFEEGSDMCSWLVTILRNTRIDAIRAKRRWPSTVPLDQAEHLAAAPVWQNMEFSEGKLWRNPQAVLDSISDAQVIEALVSLPESIRWTLLLVDVEQMGIAAAAKVLGVPEGTVKSRTARGRAMLRSALAPVAQKMGLAS